MKTVSVRDARANFSELLGLIYYTKELVVIERKGKPFTVMMSPDEYERYKKVVDKQFWKTAKEIQAKNADKDLDEVYRDVTEVVEEVRKQRYEREQKTKGRS